MDAMQQLLEREAIAREMHRYCRAIDAKDRAGYLGVFHTDAVANYTRGDVVGHDALGAFFDKFIGKLMAATQHQVSNFEIDFVSDDEASSISYVTAWHRFAEARPDYVVHGQYHDRWRRGADGWRMSERRIHVLGEVSQPRD
ncbi:MAG: nuclear transport factor 2 family protein [Acidimicrobiia bacterium]|nr:nuclear transport factor 2 family protein [Acidimicrobiia bacterium]